MSNNKLHYRNFSLKLFVFLVFYLFFLISCTPYPKEIEQVLQLAGDNRPELEKVLEHYRNDRLKYRAACFLIANMPGKYSEDNRPAEDYYPLFDRWREMLPDIQRDKAFYFDSLARTYRLQSARKVLKDVEYITSDYLIANIEQAFAMREQQPWGKDIPFDVFCEEILPYRLFAEPLEDWRSIILEQYAGLNDTLRNMPGITLMEACTLIFHALGTQWDASTHPTAIPPMNYSMSAYFRSGRCKDMAVLGTFVMRAFGIPAGMDFTPQWPHRHLGHDWNTAWNSDGSRVPFLLTECMPGEVCKPDHRMAKAFRHTFAIDKNLIIFREKTEHIPSTFRTACITDISAENFENVDVCLPLDGKHNKGKSQYAFLCVFDNRNWFPVQYAETGKNCTFRRMGKDIVYLPAYYRNGEVIPAGLPFLLTADGTIQELRADTSRQQKLKLLRKYPLLMKDADRMKGGMFQSANRSDFADAVLIHSIDKHPELHIQEIGRDYPGKFRYYRYMSPPGSHGNIAELEFYGSNGERINGRIIGTPGSKGDKSFFAKEMAFDGKVLTRFEAEEPDGAWVGMDFGKAVAVSRIRYLPRTDDNNVSTGQLYELLYWGDGRWISLGRQTAGDYVLYYDNAPANALFLLRNHTKGKEERIFTYENGKQAFW